MSENDTSARGGAEIYPWYALGVMLFTYVIAFIDRQAINLLVDPIKQELHLSDTQVSLLQGFAFALVLSLTGIPIGRWIDVGRRTRVLAVGAAVWSVMMIACGCARTYLALLLARAGVGAGESVMTPAALSLIGDYFSQRRLGLAISTYALGVHVGTGLALVLSAVVLDHVADFVVALPSGALHGWRLVFLCLTIPGFVAAAWVASLVEPKRGGMSADPPPLREVLRYFCVHGRVQLYANAAVGFALMMTYGVHAWAPSFFIRHFGLRAREVGMLLGVTTIVTGVAGVLLAGVTGDSLRKRGIVDARLQIMALAALCAAPLIALAPTASDVYFSVTLFGGANFFAAAATACGPAILQEIAPPRMRGITHAVAVLCVNLLALGCGPLVIALFTDRVLHDSQAIGTSLATVPPILIATCCVLALAGRRPFRNAAASIACNQT